jgi:hypothetical protein
MTIDLTDDETAALTRLLSQTIDNDRYSLSPRIQTLKGILAKIQPEPVRKPGARRRHVQRHPRTTSESAVLLASASKSVRE